MYFDLFFDSPPEREEGLDAESIYAVTELHLDGETLFHVQVTQEQYISMTEADKHLEKNSSKVLEKAVKTVKKSNGYSSFCPVHTYSDNVIDLYDKKKYNVNDPNVLIAADEKSKMLEVRGVVDAKSITVQ